MRWKQQSESWFAAVAFAEAGEHETARQIASTAIPEVCRTTTVLSSLRMTFAAAAFAEENCHDLASEFLLETGGKRSFLEAVGLASVRVWYGTASSGQSFAEAVGLVGVRFKVVSIPL